MRVVSGVAAAQLALHLVSGMRRIVWSLALLLVATFLSPLALPAAVPQSLVP